MSQSTEVHTRKLSRSQLLAIASGHAVEWYDFAAYAFLAPVIARVFFPSQEGLNGLLATFAVIAIAFIFRPLGGLVFGPLGDRIGRRRVLTTVILLMTVSTAVIGILPTHSAIGIWAPALLIACRALQGLSAGGEYGGAAVFLAESSHPRERGRYVSWTPACGYIGQIGASLLVLVLSTTLTDEQMSSWGWRVPFLLALPLGLTALAMRLKLVETPEFQALQDADAIEKQPLRAIFRHDRKPMAQTVGVVVLLGLGTYLTTTYAAVYLQTTAGFTPSQALWMTTITMAFMFGVIPAAGRLSDSIGRKPVMLVGCGAVALVVVPAYLVFGTESFVPALIACVVLGSVYGFYCGGAIAAVTEIFEAKRRYSGFAVSYNVSVAIFGGGASYAATYLIDKTGSSLAPSALLIAGAVIAMLTVFTLPETAPDATLRRERTLEKSVAAS